MSDEEIPLTKKDQLALEIGQGKSITQWCAKTTCPRARPTGGPTTPMSAAPWRTVAVAASIGRWH